MPRVHKLSFSSVSLYLSPTIQKFYQRSIIEKSKGWGCQNGSTVDSSEGRNPSGEFKSSYWIRVYECVLIKQSPRQWSHRIMEKFEGSINLMRHSGVKATRIHLIWALLDLFQTIWILNQDFWLYLHQLFLVPKKRLRGHLDSIFTNHCQIRSQDLLHVAEDPIDCACCDNCKRSCLEICNSFPPAVTIAKDLVWSQMTIAKDDNFKLSCPEICDFTIVFFACVVPCQSYRCVQSTGHWFISEW